MGGRTWHLDFLEKVPGILASLGGTGCCSRESRPLNLRITTMEAMLRWLPAAESASPTQPRPTGTTQSGSISSIQPLMSLEISGSRLLRCCRCREKWKEAPHAEEPELEREPLSPVTKTRAPRSWIFTPHSLRCTYPAMINHRRSTERFEEHREPTTSQRVETAVGFSTAAGCLALPTTVPGRPCRSAPKIIIRVNGAAPRRELGRQQPRQQKTPQRQSITSITVMAAAAARLKPHSPAKSAARDAGQTVKWG
jgi:hypothetical protein